MDLKQLEVLVWVAKLGSFTRAGEKLFLTQPTISAHISSLEKELGVRLIVRTPRAAYPTDEGTRLLGYANEMLRLRDEAYAALSQLGSQALRLSELFDIGAERVLAFVGAGGKTTTMFALAKELAKQGFRVAVSTTTHIFYPDARQCLEVVTDGDLKKIDAALCRKAPITVGVPCGGGKLSAPANEVLRYLQDNADYLLLEADGSRCLPIKAANSGEPVLYSGVDKVIAVGGLSCIGKPIGLACHRAQLAMEQLNVDEQHLLTSQDVAELIWSSYGRLNVPTVAALNQADNDFLRGQAGQIAAMLLKKGLPRVAVTSFLLNKYEFYTHI